MDMKKLLPYQRSLFILGDAGSERYSLFRSYASVNANLERYWHPEDVDFKQCTWVLFSADEALCYKLTASGLEDAKTIEPNETYFVSVATGQLPLNVKLVFPPYFTNEAQFTTYYEQHPLRKLSSSFIWFEGFPYGKADSAQQLRYLEDLGVRKQQLAVAITQMERNFLLTDIGNVQQGIENGQHYFMSKGYRVLQQYAILPLQRSLLLEALRHEVQYTYQILQQKQQAVEQIQASLIFIEDDLRFALEDRQWVVQLENCFSYGNVKQSKMISDIWLKQIHKLFHETITELVETELLTNYALSTIQQPQWVAFDVKKLIEILWKELERKLSLHKKDNALTRSHSTQLEYELATMKMKATWYEDINYAVQNRLPKELRRYLEQVCKKYQVLV